MACSIILSCSSQALARFAEKSERAVTLLTYDCETSAGCAHLFSEWRDDDDGEGEDFRPLWSFASAVFRAWSVEASLLWKPEKHVIHSSRFIKGVSSRLQDSDRRPFLKQRSVGKV